MADRNLIIARCDKTMFCAMCGLAWFIPISIALVEWMFGIGLLAWLIKRGVIFKALLEEDPPSGFWPRLKLLGACLKPRHSTINLPVLVFLLIVVISAIFGLNPGQSLSAVLSKVLQWIMTFVVTLEAVTTRKHVRIMGLVLLGIVALITLNGIVQYSTGKGLIRQRTVVDGRRVMSTFRHPNDLAGWLTILLPTVFSLSFIQSFRSLEGRDAFLEKSDQSGVFQSKVFIIGAFVLLLLAGFSLGVTYSRGGWLATGIGLFLLVMRHPKMLITLMVAGGIFLSIFVVKMVADRSTNVKGSYKKVFTNLSDRNTIWGEGMDLVRERPVLGIGFNNYLATAKERGHKRLEYAHNCYLQMAAETGILGLLAFLWIPVNLFRESMGQLPQLRDRYPHHLMLGLMAGLAAFLIHSFFDTNFYSTQLSSLMWLTIGLILAIPRTEGEPHSS